MHLCSPWWVQGGVYNYRLHGELYHLIESLFLSEGETPKFTQIYIHDPQTQNVERLAFIDQLDVNIVEELPQMLQEHNPYVQLYENAHQQPATPLSLQLITLRKKRRASIQYANSERDRSHHGRRWNKCERNNT
jgi:hypothetical protein